MCVSRSHRSSAAAAAAGPTLDVLCCAVCPLQVKYVTIAGTFVKGVKASGEGTLLQKFAGAGYQQVCVWGGGGAAGWGRGFHDRWLAGGCGR